MAKAPKATPPTPPSGKGGFKISRRTAILGIGGLGIASLALCNGGGNDNNAPETADAPVASTPPKTNIDIDPHIKIVFYKMTKDTPVEFEKDNGIKDVKLQAESCVRVRVADPVGHSGKSLVTTYEQASKRERTFLIEKKYLEGGHDRTPDENCVGVLLMPK